MALFGTLSAARTGPAARASTATAASIVMASSSKPWRERRGPAADRGRAPVTCGARPRPPQDRRRTSGRGRARRRPPGCPAPAWWPFGSDGHGLGTAARAHLVAAEEEPHLGLVRLRATEACCIRRRLRSPVARALVADRAADQQPRAVGQAVRRTRVTSSASERSSSRFSPCSKSLRFHAAEARFGSISSAFSKAATARGPACRPTCSSRRLVVVGAGGAREPDRRAASGADAVSPAPT